MRFRIPWPAPPALELSSALSATTVKRRGRHAQKREKRKKEPHEATNTLVRLTVKNALFLLQPVIPLRATRENVGERLRRHAHRPDHAWSIPETIEMRIVGRPQDVVGAEVVGEHRERLLDRLERDEALTVEHFARTRLDRHVVHAHVVKMPVHPIEPSRHPSSPRFQETNP